MSRSSVTDLKSQILALPRLRPRYSAVTLDLGAAGIRAYQFYGPRGGSGSSLRLVDRLQLERPVSEEIEDCGWAIDDCQAGNVGAQAPVASRQGSIVDRLCRLVGQGCFVGREVAFVLSPPDVEFYPLQLPEQALGQSPARVEAALKWEVARAARSSAEDLELRFWLLPRGRGLQANVMAAVTSSKLAAAWCEALRARHVDLRRIDVSPCALVHLCQRLWPPAEDDLWGVLDLGLRHSTLTVVVGTVPTYIRSLSVTAHQWTKQLAAAFQVSYAVADQLKRHHGVFASGVKGGVPPHPADRGFRSATPTSSPLAAEDLSAACNSVLRESLRSLAQETGRCFSYVMQSFPDCTVRRLALVGGGANLGGLAAVLETELDVPVVLLTSAAIPCGSPIPENCALNPAAAVALGGALADLEATAARRDCTANLVPATQLHARRRSRRRSVWLAVCAALGVLLAGGWGARYSAADALKRLTQEVSALEDQHRQMQVQLAAADARRSQLLDRLKLLARARQPQPWAAGLVALTRAAPDGVFLTGLDIATRELKQASGTQGPTATDKPRDEGPQGQKVGGSVSPSLSQTVRLRGYAVDHGALIQFYSAVQRLLAAAGWRQVELVRASQEPYRNVLLVGFELEGLVQVGGLSADEPSRPSDGAVPRGGRGEDWPAARGSELGTPRPELRTSTREEQP